MLAEAERLKSKLVSYRRQIHANPELSFQEFETARLVQDALQELGLTRVRSQVGRTGVTADIGPEGGPCMGVRADMDALPIEEKTDLSFKSDNPGVMHACGHDAHTAMLLGAAELLRTHYQAHPDIWQGSVRLIFQPSEEAFDSQGVSGATAMITDQALDDVDNVIAIHVNSTKPAGEVEISDGYALAAVDTFEAWIQGDGGHGAMPHQGVDPLFLLSSILPQIYGVPSRRISPVEKCVVSVGQISAGSVPNVIPSEVFVKGTIRSLDADVREQLWREVENCFKAAEALGGGYRFQLTKGYPAMLNDSQVNEWLKETTLDLAGPQALTQKEGPFSMGAEDFAYMTQAASGAMIMLGAAVPGGGAHHTPTFDISEDVLPLGSAILAETALRYVTRRFSSLES